MKTNVILVVSLCANLLLAYAYYAKKPAETSAQPTRSAVAGAGHTPSSPTDVQPTTAGTAVQVIDWRSVESEDYKRYIANLRSIGCPEETIRDIIIADVNKLFESRKQALRKPAEEFQFWKAGNPLAGMFNEKAVEQQQQLAREKRALIKELLGIEIDEKPDFFGGANPFESMLGFPSPSKQTEVMEIMQKFQARIAGSFENGAPDPEDMKKIQNIQKEMEAELARVLTPQEKEDYDLRLSQTAMMMRMQLSAFEPTEQEFREIFKLRKTFDDEFNLLGGMATQDKADTEKREAAKKQVDEQIRNLLGPERHGEYERSQSQTYQGLVRFAERQNIPRETANQVYEMKRLAEEQAKQIRSNSAFSQQQKDEALVAIQGETERAVSGVLGQPGYESYQKQPTARWLQNLGPRKR